ncbi:MAG: hypothetical protein JSV03_05630, partial [Planctomycetota bacterium]
MGIAAILISVSAVLGNADSSSPNGIYIVPQSHIDLDWVWRYDPETIEVVIPWTFGQAADNLELFPDYSFSASQVPLYEGMRKHHPRLAARVERLIRDRRFEIVGAHWVEFEGCGPCGESLVRQCMYGKRYFREVYGQDVRNAWLIDSWTHPWSLPQIFKKCEIDFYVFQRCSRGDNIFWWESPDGSRVLACRPLRHPTKIDLEKLAVDYHKRMKQMYGTDITMWRVGWGDHGGGFKADDIRNLKKQMEGASVPARFSRVDQFLKAVKDARPDWPVLRNELDFQFEGNYTNTAKLKAANRHTENLLIEAEKFAAIAARLVEIPYPKAELKSAWLEVMMNQFHDTIGGCVIQAVTEDALKRYARAES